MVYFKGTKAKCQEGRDAGTEGCSTHNALQDHVTNEISVRNVAIAEVASRPSRTRPLQKSMRKHRKMAARTISGDRAVSEFRRRKRQWLYDHRDRLGARGVIT